MRKEIADLVHPVISYALGVREQLGRGEALDLEGVQAVLKGLLGGDLERPAWADFGGDLAGGQLHKVGTASEEAFLGIRYALACWLDELFLVDSPWAEQWRERKLETALFQSNDRAWKFGEQTRLADARQATDALEVFLLCVMLGFRGDWRSQHAQLNNWVRSVKARLVRTLPQPASTLPEQGPFPVLPPLRASQQWLWRLLGPEPERTEFPEVDGAWEEALLALREADIDPVTTPLFLVLGRSAGGEDGLFEAAFAPEPARLLVRQVPARSDAPVRVFATRDAIYVTCASASLLGAQAELLHQARAPEIGGNEEGSLVASRSGSAFATIGAAGPAVRDRPPLVAAARDGWKRPGSPRRKLLDDTQAVTVLEGRLRRLCRLLVRERPSSSPLNGILVLLPCAATDRDEDATQTGLICRRDLAVVRESVRLRCPVFTLLCDLEKVPGFAEFLERFPQEQRHNRLGQSHPWLPSATPVDVAGRIAEGVHWLCEELIPGYIHQFWKAEGTSPKNSGEEVLYNQRLYRLWCQLRNRQHWLTTLFTACAQEALSDGGGPSWFAGCYLAATGRNPLHGQAFVAGVFQKLFERRKCLAWNQEALDEDRTYRRWTWLGYGAFAALLLTVAVLAWLA